MRNKKVTGIERLKVRYGRMFVLPWTIGLLLFFLVPLFTSIAYAFCNVSLVNDKMLEFVGLEHFKYLLNDDPNFMDNIKDVALGYHHSAAITNNNELYLWGYNSNGQLGDGTKTNRKTPVKIMDNVAQVSLGGNVSGI